MGAEKSLYLDQGGGKRQGRGVLSASFTQGGSGSPKPEEIEQVCPSGKGGGGTQPDSHKWKKRVHSNAARGGGVTFQEKTAIKTRRKESVSAVKWGEGSERREGLRGRRTKTEKKKKKKRPGGSRLSMTGEKGPAVNVTRGQGNVVQGTECPRLTNQEADRDVKGKKRTGVWKPRKGAKDRLTTCRQPNKPQPLKSRNRNSKLWRGKWRQKLMSIFN